MRTLVIAVVVLVVAASLLAWLLPRAGRSNDAGGQTWQTVSGGKDTVLAALTAAVRTLVVERREFLIVMVDGSENRYVQATTRAGSRVPSEVLAEAVANRYLKGDERISDAQERTLAALGWARPGSDSPNWSRTFPLGNDDAFATVAAALEETLVRVYGGSERSLRISLADPDRATSG